MRGQRVGRGLALVLALLAVAFGIEWYALQHSPFDEVNCYEQTENASEEHQAIFDGFLSRPWSTSINTGCRIAASLSDFIDRRHDLINALAAVAVALFTYTLWRSTEKLFAAAKQQGIDMAASIATAKRSADLTQLALEAAETPYLVPIVARFIKGKDVEPPSPSVIPLGSYRFENCGRSPAIILESRIEKYATGRMPDPVHFPFLETNLYHTSILPQGRLTDKIYITQGMFEGWTPADQERVAWLVGAVRYTDVFGNHFITGFCFYRNARYGHWIAIGSISHNFRRKLEGDDLRRAKERDSLTGPGAGHGWGETDT